MFDDILGFCHAHNPDILRFTRHHVSAFVNAYGPEKRLVERAAGRRCAAIALADAGSHDQLVGVNSDRSPSWPDGVAGSI